MRSLSLLEDPDDGGRVVVTPIPFERFRAEIEALYAPPMRAPATLVKMRQVLAILAGLEVETTAELTSGLVARFVASRPTTEQPNTTAGLLSYLRAACSIAEDEGWLARSPFRCRRQWIRWENAEGPRHHSLEAIRRVLELLARDVERKVGWGQWRARRLQALVATVAHTGMRKKEALYLRVEDLDFAAGTIRIRPRAGNRLKTRASAQSVPMPPALSALLSAWLPHQACPPPVRRPLKPRPGRHAESRALSRPVDPGWLFPNVYRTGPWVGGSRGHKPLDRVRGVGRRAGVEGFSFQSLRHSFATHALTAWGWTPAQVQRVLRHATVRTQAHYLHDDAANLRALGARVDLGGPTP